LACSLATDSRQARTITIAEPVAPEAKRAPIGPNDSGDPKTPVRRQIGASLEGLNLPQPSTVRARDIREQIGSVRILHVERLINHGAQPTTKGGQA
jgi:hypothetical protein